MELNSPALNARWWGGRCYRRITKGQTEAKGQAYLFIIENCIHLDGKYVLNTLSEF